MGKRAGQRAGRSAGFVTAKKVKGKKAKHIALHDQTLLKPGAVQAVEVAERASAPQRADVAALSADPEAEHVGRLPLGPDDLDGLRALLIARRVRAQRTSGELRRDESELEESKTQSAELVERSTDRTMEGALQMELEAERSLLSELDAALARMENDTYGVCAECGERVALPRLLAIPEARTCIQCARRAPSRR